MDEKYRVCEGSNSIVIPHSKPYITELEKQYVDQVLQSPVITTGSFATNFRTRIKAYLQCKHFFFTNSGSEALYLILKALGVKNGDEILLPSYVCDSVYYTIKNAGATPVLFDVNEDWIASPEQIKSRITGRTKAIIVVYTFGLPCDIKRIMEFGVPVIEDICQSMGLEINGKKAGSHGIASFVSFAAIKCITTAGEGGGLLTNNDGLSEKIEELKKQSVFTDRISEVQAAFGCAQLEQYDQYLARRKELAGSYQKTMAGSSKVLKTSYGKGMNYRFVVQTNLDVEETMKKFEEKGVSLRKGVDAVLHKSFNVPGDFNGTDKVFNSTLSFPLYPALTDQEFEIISSTIKQLL